MDTVTNTDELNGMNAAENAATEPNRLDDSEMSSTDLRKRLFSLSRALLSDVRKVSYDLENTSSPFQYTLLTIIQNSTESNPQAFVPVLLEAEVAEANTTLEETVSVCFTKWIMEKLLALLSSAAVTTIHNGCIETLLTILHLVKRRNVLVFRQLVLPLIEILNELLVFNNGEPSDHENHSINQYLVPENILKEFESGETKIATPTGLLIHSVDMSDMLQMNIMILLQKLTMDIAQHLSGHTCLLWYTLCAELEQGNFNNKKLSLNIVKDMANAAGLPFSNDCIFYLLNCLEALVVLMFSGEINTFAYSGLEESFAECWLTVLSFLENENCQFLVDGPIIYHVIEEVLTCLIKYGLSKISSKVLKEAIIKGLVILLQFIGSDGNSILSPLLDQTISVVLDNFDKLDEKNIYVPLFQYSVFQHLVDYETSIPKQERSILKTTEKLHTGNSKTLHLTNTTSTIPLNALKEYVEKSPLWNSVKEKYLQLLEKGKVSINFNDPTHLEMMMSAVGACINILLQVASEIIVQKKLEILKPEPLIYLLNLWDITLSIIYSPHALTLELQKDFIYMCDYILHSKDILLLNEEEDYISICAILSVPWLAEIFADTYDLKFKLLSSELQLYWSKLSLSNLQIETISSLSLLPSFVAPIWRLHVIFHSLKSDDAALKSSMVASLPNYLVSLGTNNHLEICHALAFTETFPTIVFAENLGKFACALASTCVLKKYRQLEKKSEVIKLSYICEVCDTNEVPVCINTSTTSWLQDTLIFCICHPEEKVRYKSVSNFSAVFAHIRITHELLEASLKLLVDESINVRVRFSENVKYLLMYHKDSFSGDSNLSEILVKELKTALVTANATTNLDLLHTILLTIGQIGQVADDDLLLISVISLMESLKSSEPSVSSIARDQLKLLAKVKGISMTDLYKKFKHLLGKFVMDALLESQADDSTLLNMLDYMVKTFGFSNVVSFLSNTLRHNLPYLVYRASPAAANLIKLFARQMDMHVRQIYVNNFKYIFSYLVCKCSKAELENALMFSQDETDIELGSLLRYDYQRTHNELLLHMSTHYDNVLNGLLMLASKDNNYKGSNSVIKKEDLAAFLQPRLLGFIAFFDSRLLNMHIPLNEKKEALESFICIMDLMGEQHITPIRIKVMATLRITLRFADGNFPNICCKAWKTFIHHVELSSLATLVNQIMATLLPLLKLDPQGVSDIFNFLVVENQDRLKEYFCDLYFIPDLPELSDVNTVLKKYTDKPSSQSDFHSVLNHSLKGVGHENIEVRLHALIKVKQLLQIHHSTLHEHLMGREIVDPLVSRLLSVIMMSCQETDKRIQCVLAEVFGEIGAVDPGRLETINTGSKQSIHFHSSVNEENFAFDLIQKLVHSFLAAEESRKQDCSSYAIQELLQIYRCHGTPDSPNPESSLWKRFSRDVQEILFPLLQSRYIPGQNKSIENIQRPIYGSSLGKSFKDWVTNWISDLVTKVKSQIASRVFTSCLMIAKYDSSCALFLFPYVVLYVIREGTDEERNELHLEIVNVLTLCEQLHPQKSDQFNQCHLSTQTVFSILDYLKRWVQYQESIASVKSSKTNHTSVPYMTVNDFISRIPQSLLAKASFQCSAFARALMYLELHIRSNKDQLQSMLSFLQKVYFSLDEPDGVAGVAAIRRYEATMEEQILQHEATGQMQEAFSCYEKALKLHPNEVSYHLGLLHCLMRLDQHHTALTYATGLLESKPNWKTDIIPYQVEAAWKLSDWGQLKSHLKLGEDIDNWSIGIGKLLLAGKEGDGETFWDQLKCIRSKQMGTLSAASMEDGGYQRGYHYLTRLHVLTDLENGFQTILKTPEGEGRLSRESLHIRKVFEEWTSRRQLIQASLRHQEPILSLQRSVLTVLHPQLKDFEEDIKYEMGLCWLESAKLARKCGHWQRAFSCLLDAGSYHIPQVFMEEAKWHWHKGEQQEAINTLQKGIQEHFPDVSEFKSIGSLGELEARQTCAKAKLTLARYSEESAIVESSLLLQMYKEVANNINPSWEDSYFYLAKYFDRMLSAADKNEKKIELAIQVIKNFGQSLQHGCKHVYHSLPRLLSLWFELGTQVVEMEKNKRSSVSFPQMEIMMSQLTNKVIPWVFDKAPAFIFLTAFPQLISRICHSHPDVVQLLQNIIAKLLVTYPQQAMWMMMSVSKSSYAARVHKCQEIFAKAKRLNPDLAKFIHDSTQFAEKLLELCNKQTAEGMSFSINSHLRSLPRLLDDARFSKIMLPLQSLMMVTLPTDISLQSNHNPFPQRPVYIIRFEDNVEILPSLQKPKKVTIRGSDGKLYVMMCKPKDDLRKDCRLMEFNNLVNRCLKRDPESRKRQLYIRTYAVIPLNEECGLIEWIPNLSGLRYILNSIYKERGLYTNSKEIRSWVLPQNASMEQKLESFRSVFLPRFPPVFADWFLRTFYDPTAWYMARLSYARTTAVISMVGYILGLGDRHGENILFDSSCGDTVHVDFNCLFNKGETFDWPERVPFRLTHNMVDALGPTKFEGVFRKACEVTMRVMRGQTEALMSVLKPFIHDPLVEWSNKKPPRSRAISLETGEIQNEKAITHVRDIELRLKGVVKSKNKAQMLPLSVEGQINYLIMEATDERNLCQMYVGWAAYM